MSDWMENLLMGIIMLCIWLLTVMYYLSRMDKKNEEIKRACTERVIGRIDQMVAFMSQSGPKPSIHILGRSRPSVSFTYQRNMVYRYSYQGREYWGMDGRMMISFFSTGKGGTPIELYCNPSRPSQFYCPAEDRNFAMTKIVTITVVTVFVAAIVITAGMQ